MRIAVVNLKGGVGKTTTSVFLASALSQLGKTLLVDADVQASAYGWSEAAGDGFPPTVPFASADLPRRIADVDQGYEHVVIDCPPADRKIITSAVMAVSAVVVPASPTGLDVDRLMPTIELLAAIEPVHPVEFAVLITRTRRGTVAGRSVRELLTAAGLPVMDTEIPLAEMFAASFGSIPSDLGAYEDLAEELLS